jgi:hypothetical protein
MVLVLKQELGALAQLLLVAGKQGIVQDREALEWSVHQIHYREELQPEHSIRHQQAKLN